MIGNDFVNDSGLEVFGCTFYYHPSLILGLYRLFLIMRCNISLRSNWMIKQFEKFVTQLRLFFLFIFLKIALP